MRSLRERMTEEGLTTRGLKPEAADAYGWAVAKAETIGEDMTGVLFEGSPQFRRPVIKNGALVAAKVKLSGVGTDIRTHYKDESEEK